jgi:uncharacterized lipoprotein YddW (UPF0748 family)
MDFLASINFNVVFPVVNNKEDTLYPGAIMDLLSGESAIPEYTFADRDSTDCLSIEAHRNAIELIPWFEYGFSSSLQILLW